MEEVKVVVEMTAEEAAKLEALRKELADREEAQRRQADREAYKALAEELVAKYMPRIVALSSEMQQLKTDVYREFDQLLRTKGDLFSVKQGQRSHNFRSADGSMRIQLGYHKRDGWDILTEDGVQMVKEYISSLAGNAEDAMLVEIILDLLSKDKSGNLQADKVLQLSTYVDRIESEKFREGVRIIQEGYRPELSKQYIRAEVKTSTGKWMVIPLSVTEVDIIPAPKAEVEPNNE